MKKLPTYIFLSLISLTVFIYWVIFSILAIPELEVSFLAVGQGDAELIRTAAGNILIDGGPGARTVSQIDRVLPFYDRTIDVVLLTHPNLDHLAGLPEVLRRYNVRLFVMTGAEATLAEYQEIKRLLKEKNIPVLYTVRGQEISLGGPSPRRSGLRPREGGPTMTILWPDELLRFKSIPRKALNDTSIVALLSYQNFGALFTGDLSGKGEKSLLPALENIDVDILKVSHHGSKSSSIREFLEKISPEIAVIQVGKNSYGHPTQEALSRLAAVGAHIFRTDLDGTITVQAKNSKFEIKKLRN